MEIRSNPTKRIRRYFVASFLPAAFFLLPFANEAAPQQKTAAQIEAGRKLFAGSCSNSYCHGSAGTGGGGPKLKEREFTAEFLTRTITEGLPGTAMPSFKERYNQEQIAQLVVYVLSLSPNNPNAKIDNNQGSTSVDPHFSGAKPRAAEKTPANPDLSATANKAAATSPSSGSSSGTVGDVLAGRDIFFDSAQTQNCRVCHMVQGMGGRIGPDLSKVADKPAREILQSIVAPDSIIDPKYATIALTTTDGARFVGVKRDEDETMIRLYDTSMLPPVSRAFLKSEVAKIEKLTTSAMPHDYGSKYSQKQLLDIVSFLKTVDPAKPVSLNLKDLF